MAEILAVGLRELLGDVEGSRGIDRHPFYSDGTRILEQLAKIQRWLFLHNFAIGNRYAEKAPFRAVPVSQNIPLRGIRVPIIRGKLDHSALVFGRKNTQCHQRGIRVCWRRRKLRESEVLCHRPARRRAGEDFEISFANYCEVGKICLAARQGR